MRLQENLCQFHSVIAIANELGRASGAESGLTNQAGKPAEDSEEDVDEKFGAAAGFEKDSEGREEDGEEIEEDITL